MDKEKTTEVSPPNPTLSSKPATTQQLGKLSFGLKPTFRGLPTQFAGASDDKSVASGAPGESGTGTPKTSSFSRAWSEATKNKGSQDVTGVESPVADAKDGSAESKVDSRQSSEKHEENGESSTTGGVEEAEPLVNVEKDVSAAAADANMTETGDAGSSDAQEQSASLTVNDIVDAIDKSNETDAVSEKEQPDGENPKSPKASPMLVAPTTPASENKPNEKKSENTQSSKRNRRFGREPKRHWSQSKQQTRSRSSAAAARENADVDANADAEGDRKRRRSSERGSDRGIVVSCRVVIFVAVPFISSAARARTREITRPTSTYTFGGSRSKLLSIVSARTTMRMRTVANNVDRGNVSRIEVPSF